MFHNTGIISYINIYNASTAVTPVAYYHRVGYDPQDALIIFYNHASAFVLGQSRLKGHSFFKEEFPRAPQETLSCHDFPGFSIFAAVILLFLFSKTSFGPSSEVHGTLKTTMGLSRAQMEILIKPLLGPGGRFASKTAARQFQN